MVTRFKIYDIHFAFSNVWTYHFHTKVDEIECILSLLLPDTANLSPHISHLVIVQSKFFYMNLDWRHQHGDL